MDKSFEFAGDMESWPKNESGKPTQAAVFGVMHPTKGKCCELLWTGQFPDLEPAMYWAAKKEMHAVRKDKWIIASRVLWQHAITPEQAVESCFKMMSPQIDQAMKSLEGDEEFDGNLGDMKPVDPKNVKGYYVEVVPKDDDEADPIASFIAPPPPQDDVEVTWLTDDKKREDWIPGDPREK